MCRSKLLLLLLFLLIFLLICRTGFRPFQSNCQRSEKVVICVKTSFNCCLCARRMRFVSCTMKTRQSRVTTSWTNGFSPSHSPSSSSSRLRWTVRQTPSKLTHFQDMDSGWEDYYLSAHLKIHPIWQHIHVSIFSVNILTVLSCCSVPPVHRRASSGQVCGHAHQLVRQDQQTPSKGEITPLNQCLFRVNVVFI